MPSRRASDPPAHCEGDFVVIHRARRRGRAARRLSTRTHAVHALVAKSSIEALNERVFHWLAWPNKFEPHVVCEGPRVHRSTDEFSTTSRELRYRLRRLRCRTCGIRTERVGFAEPHARLTRLFRQRIGLNSQSMPPSHVAVRHAVSWGRRAGRNARFSTRGTGRGRHTVPGIRVDEVQRGKRAAILDGALRLGPR